MFSIKYFMSLQDISVSSLKSFVLIITCSLKIFINQYYVLKLLFFLETFISYLIIRMMKSVMLVSIIELQKLFVTLIINLLRSCLSMMILLKIKQKVKLFLKIDQSFHQLSVSLHAKHLITVLISF